MMRYLTCLFLIIILSCENSPNNPVINNYYSTDSLSNPNVKPRVIFTNPSNGAIGPFIDYNINNNPSNPQITIQFNKLINVMNFHDLNNKFIVLKTKSKNYPLYLINNQSTEGNTYSFLQNILLLSFQEKYLANEIYTVTVDTTLFDVHGYRLTIPYVFSFTPEPQFRVYGFSRNNIDVSITFFSPLSINLNSKVDSSFFDKISISPPIHGSWHFNPYYPLINDSTMIFYFSKDTLLYDTQYTVSIAGDAKDINGLTIKEPYHFSFTTESFKVSLSSYASIFGPRGFNIQDFFTFTFNGLADTASVRSSIIVTPIVPFTINLNSSGNGCNSVYLSLQEDKLLPSTTYQIQFKNTIRSIKGVYFKDPFSYFFITGS
jgi:hypothetical protein